MLICFVANVTYESFAEALTSGFLDLFVSLCLTHGRGVALAFTCVRWVAVGFSHERVGFDGVGREVALGFDHGREGFDHRKGLGLC